MPIDILDQSASRPRPALSTSGAQGGDVPLGYTQSAPAGEQPTSDGKPSTSRSNFAADAEQPASAAEQPRRSLSRPVEQPADGDDFDEAAAVAQLASARAALATPVPEVKTPGPAPARDTFDDPDAYFAALAAWSADQAAHKMQRDTATGYRAKLQAAVNTAAKELWEARSARFGAEHADFADVALADPKDGGPTITPLMADAIMQLEAGPGVAYFLGKNRKEAARIAGLAPIDQASEIGRLAERIGRGQARSSSPAPARRAAPTPQPQAEEDSNTYYERRTRELYPQAKADAMISASRRWN